MRHRIYFHLVWTTLDRMPLIDEKRSRCLQRLVPAISREAGAHLLGLGLVTTHVHVLVRVPPGFDCGRFVGRTKSVSALLARRDRLGDPSRPLRWVEGYSITSVGPGEVDRVLQYVLGQSRRHPREAIREAGKVD